MLGSRLNFSDYRLVTSDRVSLHCEYIFYTALTLHSVTHNSNQ